MPFRRTLTASARPRPLLGLVYGAVPGLFFGGIWLLTKPTATALRLAGGLLGASVIGLLIGSAAPLLSRRFLGGAVIGLSGAIGYFVAAKVWGEPLLDTVGGMILTGAGWTLGAWVF